MDSADVQRRSQERRRAETPALPPRARAYSIRRWRMGAPTCPKAEPGRFSTLLSDHSVYAFAVDLALPQWPSKGLFYAIAHQYTTCYSNLPNIPARSSLQLYSAQRAHPAQKSIVMPLLSKLGLLCSFETIAVASTTAAHRVPPIVEQVSHIGMFSDVANHTYECEPSRRSYGGTGHS